MMRRRWLDRARSRLVAIDSPRKFVLAVLTLFVAMYVGVHILLWVVGL